MHLIVDGYKGNLTIM